MKLYWHILASGLGAAITLPICGLLISAWGWKSVFYITGIVGITWSAMWFNLVFETPAEHPRITEQERYYIESEIAKQSNPSTKVITITYMFYGRERFRKTAVRHSRMIGNSLIC